MGHPVIRSLQYRVLQRFLIAILKGTFCYANKLAILFYYKFIIQMSCTVYNIHIISYNFDI